jgi:hypothetical protein
MEPPAGREGEFESWYDEEHIPLRMAIAGFESAVRYRALEGTPSHLAVYHLELEALETDAYRRVKSEPGERTATMLQSVVGFTRYTCTLTSDTGPSDEQPGCLFVTAFAVPPTDERELESWYEEEHVPLLMQVDGWLRVRRYRTQLGGEGPPWTHLALHELRDRDVMDAPERSRARATDRRAALAERAWFSSSGRWLYRPIAHHPALVP